MKLLLISDVESPALWDHYRPERMEGVDLIISCGDLKRSYLEFLVTMSNKPVLYVPGNHDTAYADNPPEGCECIDGQVVVVGGLRIMGLGGCKRYNETPAYQYTEAEMKKRIRKLDRSIRRVGGVDIVVTHAPATGYGDAQDNAHKGFDCFVDLMDTYKPSYMFHGHIHRSYGWSIPRSLQYKDTTIINAFERYILDIPDELACHQPKPTLLERLRGR